MLVGWEEGKLNCARDQLGLNSERRKLFIWEAWGDSVFAGSIV